MKRYLAVILASTMLQLCHMYLLVGGTSAGASDVSSCATVNFTLGTNLFPLRAKYSALICSMSGASLLSKQRKVFLQFIDGC